MGLLSRFRKRPAVSGAWPYQPDYPDAWRIAQHEYIRVMGMSAGDIWRTQPYLRTVVSFLARNVAQLGVQVFLRTGDLDRTRVRDGALVDAIRRPNAATTGYELIYGTVSDLAVYDRCHWLIAPDPDNPILRVPPSWVQPKGGDMLTPEWYEVRSNDRGEAVEVKPENMLTFHGWHPESLMAGSSPIHALRSLLAEQVQAAAYREAVWRRGGKVGGVITRPADAPEWSEKAKERFRADWQSRFTDQGSEVGGTPILEDGMTLNRVDFSAKEMEFIEGSKLALSTCASAYHVNPTLVGVLDNANYSNVKEFRRMLYGDTLGPVLAQMQDRINTFLVPRLDSRDGVYVEFNIEAKLQGSFEEQAAVISAATGAPWMLRNEARALRNLPEVDGGDELVVPLNVVAGGLASPRDTNPRPLPAAASKVPELKSKVRDDTHDAQAWAILTRFFRRQGNDVKSKLGGTDLASAWDGDRWDRELADDLMRVANLVTTDIAGKTLERLGFATDDYDMDRTLAFLKALSDRVAHSVNRTTYKQLSKAVVSDEPTEQVAHVFDNAAGSRAAQVATTATTAYAGFATTEAAKQVAGDRATKTWVVTSGNPRPEHAELNGQTVPLDQPFSSGQMWPGDATGDADDTAGCNCELDINIA